MRMKGIWHDTSLFHSTYEIRAAIEKLWISLRVRDKINNLQVNIPILWSYRRKKKQISWSYFIFSFFSIGINKEFRFHCDIFQFRVRRIIRLSSRLNTRQTFPKPFAELVTWCVAWWASTFSVYHEKFQI